MIAKILLGVVILLAGLWLLLPLPVSLPYQGAAWGDFKAAMWGLIPPVMVFVGGLMVWIEMEDRKAGG